MSNYLNVALVQIASSSLHPDLAARKQENWARLAFYFEQIARMSPTVDLLLAPDLYVDGLDPLNWNALAEPIPGPMSELFCAKARQLGKWLAPGSMLETSEEGDVPHNTALLISPEGEIVLKYRKTFIQYPVEPSHPGSGFPVFEIPDRCTVGFMLSAEDHVPEVARNLVLNGAEVILKPTLQPFWIGGVANLTPFTQVRAAENQCYVVCVNQAAPVSLGHSSVADPEGRLKEEMDSTESWTMLSLDLDEVRRVREIGSFGCFPLLRMLRDFTKLGIPLDEAYRRGIEQAPLFERLTAPMPFAPGEIVPTHL